MVRNYITCIYSDSARVTVLAQMYGRQGTGARHDRAWPRAGAIASATQHYCAFDHESVSMNYKPRKGIDYGIAVCYVRYALGLVASPPWDRTTLKPKP